MVKLIKLWILGSAACVSAGWILSAFHQLNQTGYAVYFSVWMAAAIVISRIRRPPPLRFPQAQRWLNSRRFRRPLPLIFLLTGVLAAVGGAIHAPNNYDALTYRFPRMLHWWHESTWHWINTPNERMNLSGANFEWMMMPLFSVTHSDRLFFLLNIISYALMPTLIFLVFVSAGVKGRVAGFWMWVLPSALCYAMQAGSISNDTIAVTYFLAAIYFALRARQRDCVEDLWLSILAAALLTGVKGSDLPLLLPVAWAVWHALRPAVKRIMATAVVILLAFFISFLPIAYENSKHTGDWAGDPTNHQNLRVENPFAGILGNGLQLALQNLGPPFLPLARTVENWVWDRFPQPLREILNRDFPRFVVGFRELPQEESSGVGIAITIMAIIGFIADTRYRIRHKIVAPHPGSYEGLTLGLLTWVSLFVYMAKLGSESTSRLIAAYYPMLLLPLLLNPAQDALVRKRWYRFLGAASGVIALIAVVLTPSRPMWPAKAFFNWAVAEWPDSEMMPHARTVFEIYRHRNDPFIELRKSIPDSVPVIGLIEGIDDAEASLWRPYGHRRVVLVVNPNEVTRSKLQWIVVKNHAFDQDAHNTFEQWVKHTHGTVLTQQEITEKAGAGPELWSVVHLPADSR